MEEKLVPGECEFVNSVGGGKEHACVFSLSTGQKGREQSWEKVV